MCSAMFSVLLMSLAKGFPFLYGVLPASCNRSDAQWRKREKIQLIIKQNYEKGCISISANKNLLRNADHCPRGVFHQYTYIHTNIHSFTVGMNEVGYTPSNKIYANLLVIQYESGRWRRGIKLWGFN